MAGRNLDLVRTLAEHCSDNDAVHSSARAAVDALMQGTLITRTNQVKCRELGAIAPLLRLLEPPEEGPPDTEAQRCSMWTLSNICCELTAARRKAKAH